MGNVDADDRYEDRHDGLSRYCRLLGHDVLFSYCRKPGSESFCRNIIGCWRGRIDIETYVRTHYTDRQIAESMKPPAEKMTTLVDLIQRAREGS